MPSNAEKRAQAYMERRASQAATTSLSKDNAANTSFDRRNSANASLTRSSKSKTTIAAHNREPSLDTTAHHLSGASLAAITP